MTEKAILNQAVKNRKRGIKRSFSDKLISVITYIVYAIFAFVCVYPFYYIFINSISANNLSERGKVIFYPMEVHLKNYSSVFKIPGLMDAAVISVLRTVVGTLFTVLVAAFLGYMFTRKTLWKRKFWYRFVAATMYFNAGVIPWYLTMKMMGLTNNFWGYIFPMMIQPFYIILCKTFVEFGGLLGHAPVMPVNQYSCEAFVSRQGRIPAPIHSFKN